MEILFLPHSIKKSISAPQRIRTFTGLRSYIVYITPFSISLNLIIEENDFVNKTDFIELFWQTK